MKEPDWAEWNLKTVELVQATLGLIRPEIRMISLLRGARGWRVEVIVDREDPDLRDHISEEILGDFEALQSNGRELESSSITVMNGGLTAPSPPGRAIYVRYEP